MIEFGASHRCRHALSFSEKMKTQVIIALIVGSCLGSLATYFAVNPARDIPRSGLQVANQPERAELDESGNVIDPFAEGSDVGDSDTTGHQIGDSKMDMSDVFQRDACISLWYSDMTMLVDNLEMRTGHKFEKQVGKVYAGPVEILEEQAEFMRRYLAETERIAAAGKTDSDEAKE